MHPYYQKKTYVQSNINFAQTIHFNLIEIEIKKKYLLLKSKLKHE